MCVAGFISSTLIYQTVGTIYEEVLPDTLTAAQTREVGSPPSARFRDSRKPPACQCLITFRRFYGALRHATVWQGIFAFIDKFGSTNHRYARNLLVKG